MARKYDMKKRRYMAWMRQLKDALCEVRRRDRQEERGGGFSEGRSRKVRRQKKRESLLPQDRICPECGDMVLQSRRWVVKEKRVVCRRCWQKNKV